MSKMVYVSHFKHCTHALGKKPFEAAAAATADTLGGGGYYNTYHCQIKYEHKTGSYGLDGGANITPLLQF